MSTMRFHSNVRTLCLVGHGRLENLHQHKDYYRQLLVPDNHLVRTDNSHR